MPAVASETIAPEARVFVPSDSAQVHGSLSVASMAPRNAITENTPLTFGVIVTLVETVAAGPFVWP